MEWINAKKSLEYQYQFIEVCYTWKKKLLDSIDTTVIDNYIDNLSKYLVWDNKTLKDKIKARKYLWIRAVKRHTILRDRIHDQAESLTKVRTKTKEKDEDGKSILKST